MYGKGFVNTWITDHSKQLKIFTNKSVWSVWTHKKSLQSLKTCYSHVIFSMCALLDNVLKILTLKVLSLTNFSKSGQGKKSCKAV